MAKKYYLSVNNQLVEVTLNMFKKMVNQKVQDNLKVKGDK